MDLEKEFYRTNEVGFYTFIKWYRNYIEEVIYHNEGEGLAVSNGYKYIAYRIDSLVDNEEDIFYVDKNYIDIMKDFDFSTVLPKRMEHIIKEEEENGKTEYKLKITEYKM